MCRGILCLLATWSPNRVARLIDFVFAWLGLVWALVSLGLTCSGGRCLVYFVAADVVLSDISLLGR